MRRRGRKAFPAGRTHGPAAHAGLISFSDADQDAGRGAGNGNGPKHLSRQGRTSSDGGRKSRWRRIAEAKAKAIAEAGAKAKVSRRNRCPAKEPSRQKGFEMKSYIAKPSEIERKWYVVDAEGKTLGRLASKVAAILRGKNKPTYTPHMDCGDYVIVINAEKVKVTGKKMTDKLYVSYSGFPGGKKEVALKELLEKKPDEIVRHAVKGMMPDGKLGRQMFKKLKVYAGPEHNHEAQKPETLEI
jgi:large subunit ribosomal protein L13